MQSAQAISAAYDFNLTARDFMLADGAIESVIEGVPSAAVSEAICEIASNSSMRAAVEY